MDYGLSSLLVIKFCRPHDFGLPEDEWLVQRPFKTLLCDLSSTHVRVCTPIYPPG